MAQQASSQITGGPHDYGFIKKSRKAKTTIPFRTAKGLIQAQVGKIQSYDRNSREVIMYCDCELPDGKTKRDARIEYSFSSFSGTISGLAY